MVLTGVMLVRLRLGLDDSEYRQRRKTAIFRMLATMNDIGVDVPVGFAVICLSVHI